MNYRTLAPANKVILQVLVISVISSLIINVCTEDVTNNESSVVMIKNEFSDGSTINPFSSSDYYVSTSTKEVTHGSTESHKSTVDSTFASTNVTLPEVGSSQTPWTRAQSEAESETSLTEPPQIVCGPVRSPVHKLERTRITIEWTAPDNDCNGEYLIELIYSGNQSVIEFKTTTDVQVEFSGLEYCENYIYRITPYDVQSNPGEANERNFKTDTVAPSVVTQLTYNSTSSVESASTSVTVTWDVPRYGKKCVKNYEVLMWRRDRESEEEDPNIIAENITSKTITRNELTACEVYVFHVTTIVDENTRGELNELIMTMAARLPVAPSKTERESFGPNYLNLSTVNNDIKSVCYPSIAKFMCIYEGTDPEAEKETTQTVEIENPEDTKYFAVFEDLLPYSMYNCTAMLYNIMGWSSPSLISGVHLTEEDVPDRPTNVQVNETTTNSFRLTWDKPDKANGVLNYYRIYIRMVKPLYMIPDIDACSPIRTINISHTEAATVFSRIVEELNPYVLYSVQVAASNGKGVGDYSDTVFVETKSAPSEEVKNFLNDVILPTSVTEYNAVYPFMWDLPCRTNGLLTGFKIVAEGTRINYDTHMLEYFVNATDNSSYVFDIEDFKPSYGYNTTIVPVTADAESNERNRMSFIFVTSEPAVPQANNYIDWGYIDTTQAPNPTKTAFIKVDNWVLQSDLGQISWAAILISELGCQDPPEPKNGLLKPIGIDWPPSLSWHDVQNMDCVPQYQATPKCWTVDDSKPIHFTIGTDDCTNVKDFCNGALKPGTRYGVTVRIFTTTGYSDTQMIVFETDNVIAILLIVTSIAALLLSSFIIGLLILYKKGMFEPSPGLTILPGIDEINGKNFIERYNEMTANKNEKLIKEYKTIEADTAILENYSFNAARQNAGKNRYSNIHPFDHNRVVLKMDDGDSDYINASYIDGFKQEKEYIACQGPKPETCNDFWRMILELRVESIIMLTSFKEGNKVKCAEYFPPKGEFRYYDDIIVRSNDDLSSDTHKKRTFIVEKGQEMIHITHYHFLKWLDHDCPKNPYDLIKFVKQVRTERKVLDVPLVVHCSAGVGRTGTFIALDIIMQKIKEEKRLNIYEIVKQLRTQRVKMVQTPGQYVYLYKCVYELMKREKTWTQRILEKIIKSPESEEEDYDCNAVMTELSPKLNGTKTENGHVTNNESNI